LILAGTVLSRLYGKQERGFDLDLKRLGCDSSWTPYQAAIGVWTRGWFRHRRIDRGLGDDFCVIVAKRDRNRELPADEKTNQSDVLIVMKA
jgi:hypothetical protein